MSPYVTSQSIKILCENPQLSCCLVHTHMVFPVFPFPTSAEVWAEELGLSSRVSKSRFVRRPVGDLIGL